MAIGDASAIGDDFDDAAIARLPLGLQEIVVPALQVDGTTDQHGEAGEEQQHHESRAPHRQAQGQDGTGGEVHCDAPL